MLALSSSTLLNLGRARFKRIHLIPFFESLRRQFRSAGWRGTKPDIKQCIPKPNPLWHRRFNVNPSFRLLPGYHSLKVAALPVLQLNLSSIILLLKPLQPRKTRRSKGHLNGIGRRFINALNYDTRPGSVLMDEKPIADPPFPGFPIGKTFNAMPKGSVLNNFDE